MNTSLALPFLGFGIAGWAIENTLSARPRYSAAFGGAYVPFLPVYAVGGTALALIAPSVKRTGLPWPVRGAVYAGLLSAVELAGCGIDRKMLGHKSWDYGQGTRENLRGCVDVTHALLWGAAGLAIEALVT